MSKQLRKKSFLLVVLAFISMLILGISLNSLIVDLSLNNYKNDMKQELTQVKSLFKDAEEEKNATIENYDAIYQSKAASVAFMVHNNPNFKIDNVQMMSEKNLLNVNNVLIVDNTGNISAQAEQTNAVFSRQRFNQLKTVFSDHLPSKAFEVKYDKNTYRYYGAYINDTSMVVIEQDPKEIKEYLESTTSQAAVLSKVHLGLEGYTFSISAQNYMVLYHPNADLIGADAINAGVPVEELEDGNFEWLTINGQKVYAGISLVDDTYYISAIPENEIQSTRTLLLGVILFIFFAVMAIVILYGIFVMRAEEKRPYKAKHYKSYGKYTYNKIVGKKATTLLIVGLICIMIITYYMQSLTAISQRSVSNNQRISFVEETLLQNEKDIETLTQQYNERYLGKTKVAAQVLTDNNALMTDKKKLTELADTLQIKEVNVFNKDGILIGTNAAYSDFTISQDPKVQSYEFNKVLQGADYLVQKAQENEATGEFFQYLGMPIIINNEITGMVQIGVRPERLENLLANTKVDKVLDGIRVGVNGFAFAVDKENHTFSYYPDEKMIGRDALEYGMRESQLKDNFDDFIEIDGVSYFGSSLQSDNNYIYVVVPEDEIAQNNLAISLATGVISLICLLCIFVLLSFSKNQPNTDVNTVEKNHAKMMYVTMADGNVKKSESITSRFMNLSIGWDEKTPEQQISTVMKWLLGILAIMICVAVLFQDKLFEPDSIFAYILSFNWEKEINIFAITGTIIVVSIVTVLTSILRKILIQLATTFGTRGETICRLLISFLKYISIFGMLFFCLSLFGVNTNTLLASAGILSLVIGLGAQDLIKDILSGLFIIFEGEFRVGDIVMIGSYRGTVVEIGVRTTKIQDAGANIKIISNSDVSDVINMTKQYSFAFCDVGIEYGESLERVESILAKEFPNIKKRLPAIHDGPFYKGVVSLGDNSVNIRIMAQCHESDRVQLERDLNREMKILFDKHNINIPFPQVVINQPTEYTEATILEKMEADKFASEQKEATRELYEENNGEH